MSRISKALGLTFVAMLALGAVFASGASAAEFTSFNTTTEKHESGTFKGEDLTQARFAATAGGLEVFCNETAYEGSSATGTETTPKAKPTYGDCHVIIFGEERAAEVKTNGCEYQFHIDSGSGDTYTGHISVVGCTAIEVVVPSTGCIDSVSSANNTNITGVTYRNTTEKSPTDIDIEVESSNVHNSTNGGLLKCGTSSGTHASGTFKGNATVRAFNTEGKQIDLTIM